MSSQPAPIDCSVHGGTRNYGLPEFSQPAYRAHPATNVIERFFWDTSGRLEAREDGTTAYAYKYDGAWRLGQVTVGPDTTDYGYDVDDTLVLEEHPDGNGYRG